MSAIRPTTISQGGNDGDHEGVLTVCHPKVSRYHEMVIRIKNNILLLANKEQAIWFCDQKIKNLFEIERYQAFGFYFYNAQPTKKLVYG